MLAPEVFLKLTPILPYVDAINLDNHGEPLLNPHLEEFIRIAKSAAPKITTSFTTNLLLMNVERAKKLLESGLDVLQVSVAAVHKATYDRIMINGDFSKFIKNLEGFQSVLRSSQEKLRRFSACVTAMRSNIDELPFVPEFIARFGITELRINSILPFSSEALEESLLEADEVVAHSKNVYEETMRNATRLGITATCVLTPDVLASEGNIVCEYPIKRFSVSYNGDICPCWMLDLPGGYDCYFQGETYEVPYVKLGNIREASILDILNNPGSVAFRKQFTRGDLPGFCKYCPVGKHLICG